MGKDRDAISVADNNFIRHAGEYVREMESERNVY
jgi:hypothetical protein